MLKKAQVIMLPTDKSNIVLINPKKEFLIGTKTDKAFLQGGKDWVYNSTITDNSSIPQHLYIISDDEIKEGDWVIIKGMTTSVVHQVKSLFKDNTAKKIIATTDASLRIEDYSIEFSGGMITDNSYILPQPSQQFIEKYIESYNKGEIITDVLVEYELFNTKPNSAPIYGKFEEKFKVNPKDNTITIKKLKDNWNREEVIELLHKLNNTLNIGSDLTLEQWIKKNL